MMTQLANLNWISILIALVSYSALGALWFTLLFTKAYKISLGKAGETLQNKAPIFMIGPAICTLAIVMASAIFIYALNLDSIAQALEFALVAGFGFLVANTVNIAINPNIPRPILYGIISGSFHMVGITISSIILVVMK